MSNYSIIGVSWSHPSGACLIQDNRVIIAVSEERFTRRKNETEFPWRSIKYCMDEANGKVEYIAFAENFVSYPAQFLQKTKFSIKDMLFEQRNYWYPKIYNGEDLDEALTLEKFQVNDQYPKEYWKEYDKAKNKSFNFDR